MTTAARLDRLQQRHPALSFPIAVIYKYGDDAGPQLAALIAYYAFISLFPLLLLLTTIMGFLLQGDPGLRASIETSALRQVPVVGEDLGHPKTFGGGAAGLVIGLLGSVYGGLGVAQAAQYLMNTAWAIPRNDRPNPLKARGRSLLLLLTGGIGVIGTTVLSTFGASGAGPSAVALRVLVLIASFALNVVVISAAFRIATAGPISTRMVLPGAIVAAVGWQALQTFGVTYVTHVVKRASATNSVFALVLGLIAFLYLTSVLVVFCVEINVVRAKRLYPRALLTPFTDDVDLTHGDERTYTGMAKAQRSKGFQNIDVTFEPGESD
jgi:membrane protein